MFMAHLVSCRSSTRRKRQKTLIATEDVVGLESDEMEVEIRTEYRVGCLYIKTRLAHTLAFLYNISVEK